MKTRGPYALEKLGQASCVTNHLVINGRLSCGLVVERFDKFPPTSTPPEQKTQVFL